ncbi:hypothetical protein F2Q68_00002381 [Brassica cretica]|uniref:Uncharacterized protein n=1 Tax=Brassica cretica TaxID=69181 RepID=A0A8S9JGE6_BRACR|nr:hypothetical protein F2Q68_00002381 [Brassica cretica]
MRVKVREVRESISLSVLSSPKPLPLAVPLLYPLRWPTVGLVPSAATPTSPRRVQSSPCQDTVTSPPLCFSFSGFYRIAARSGDQIDFWVCTQCLWREGEVVTVWKLTRGTNCFVDLGFVLSRFWVRSASEVCRTESVAASLPPGYRLLCSPLTLSLFGCCCRWSRVRAVLSFVRSPKSGLASLPPADWSFVSSALQVSKGSRQPLPDFSMLCSQSFCAGHALPSSGVDNVWSRFHWVSMAGPRLGLPCFACHPCRSRLRDGPSIMSVPRSTEAKYLLLAACFDKLLRC